MKYKICNLPLWTGKAKARLAKALARRCSTWAFSQDKRFTTLKIGDVINDCSGYNHVVKEITPKYLKVGKGHVLCDITFTTDNGGRCSLTSCGVEVNVSREIIEKRHLEYYETWVKGAGGQTWYGPEDTWTDQTRADMALADRRAETLKSGGHICDEQGFLLEEFTRHELPSPSDQS